MTLFPVLGYTGLLSHSYSQLRYTCCDMLLSTVM